ncbi:MAG: hypothetical protein FWC39_05660 [Bacteroidetes bacterium]|nr:hypothetical protein [Bacteroidota bacterium]
MKKLISISTIALAAILMFGSCKKDKTKPDVYVSETQSKEVLQNAAVNYVQELQSIQTGDFYTATMNLYGLMAQSGMFGGDYDDPYLYSMNFKSGNVLKDEIFGEDAGVYTWNKAKGDFDFVAGNGLKFLFPYSDASSGNDCELVVSYASSNQLLPVNNINSTMKVKGKQVFKCTATAKYGADGKPELTTTSVEIEDLKYTLEQTANNSKVGFKSSWKKGNKILSATEISVTGKFSEAELDAIMETLMGIEDEELMAMAFLQSGVFDKISFSYQIMNVKSSVDVDVTSMAKQMGELPMPPSDEAKFNVVNKNVNTKVVNTDNNNILAKIIFDYDKGMLLSFGDDKSAVAAETYFTSGGFEELQDLIMGIVGGFMQPDMASMY